MKSAPIFNRRKMYHWLTQFIFAINRFHGICLVHNINQMRGLGDAPKHFTDPNSKLVIIPIREKKRFSNVTVGSFIIEAIDSKKRCEGEATLSALEVPVKFRLNYNRALAFTLPLQPLREKLSMLNIQLPRKLKCEQRGRYQHREYSAKLVYSFAHIHTTPLFNSLEHVFVEVILFQPCLKAQIASVQFCTFASLVIRHCHGMCTPIFIEVLLIISES